MSEENNPYGLTEEELDGLKELEAEEQQAATETEAKTETEIKSEADAVDNTEEVKANDDSSQQETYQAPQAEKSPDELLKDLNEARRQIRSNLDSERKELRRKYNEGEIDQDDYDNQIDDIDARLYNLSERYAEEHAKITRLQVKAEIAQEQAVQRWQMEQQIFFSEHKNYATDQRRMTLLRAELESMNGSKDIEGKTGLEILRLAESRVSEYLGEKKQQAKEAKPSNVKEFPKTLTNIPAAEEETERGEFDYLDKLNGEAYEKAFAKLTKEQIARYAGAR